MVVEVLVVVTVHLGENLVMRSTYRWMEEAWDMTFDSLEAFKDYSVGDLYLGHWY
jgi:hypothetical protein